MHSEKNVLFCLFELTRLFLQELPLAVDDTQDEESQEDGGQSATDDCRQRHVSGAGHCGRDGHQIHTDAA